MQAKWAATHLRPAIGGRCCGVQISNDARRQLSVRGLQESQSCSCERQQRSRPARRSVRGHGSCLVRRTCRGTRCCTARRAPRQEGGCTARPALCRKAGSPAGFARLRTPFHGLSREHGSTNREIAVSWSSDAPAAAATGRQSTGGDAFLVQLGTRNRSGGSTKGWPLRIAHTTKRMKEVCSVSRGGGTGRASKRSSGLRLGQHQVPDEGSNASRARFARPERKTNSSRVR